MTVYALTSSSQTVVDWVNTKSVKDVCLSALRPEYERAAIPRGRCDHQQSQRVQTCVCLSALGPERAAIPRGCCDHQQSQRVQTCVCLSALGPEGAAITSSLREFKHVSVYLPSGQSGRQTPEGAAITSSLREFAGHTQRVTDICWSPHHDGRLISVGYDAEAIVSGDIILQCCSCQWHLLMMIIIIGWREKE